jgi:ribonuclease J
MVLRLPLSIMSLIANKMIEKQCLHEANFIYSMWPGYLKRDPKFRQFSETYKIPITKIHTSGHAYLDDLKRLSKALNPMILLPIHTLHGDDFQNHFANVVRIQDGEAFQI